MRPELKTATRNLVVTEAGKHMTTWGIAQIEMKLRNKIFTWPMYVALIRDNVLLGCDLIDEKDISINCKRGLEMNGECIECQTTRQIDGIARVRIKKSMTIPANFEIIIAGERYDKEQLSSRYSILEPVVEDSRKIMVARTLVDAHSCKVHVRFINLDEQPVKLRKSYLLGELHRVQNISEVIDLEKKKIIRSVQKKLKVHLQKLRNLLLTNEDAFASNKTELGTFALVKHKIDTAGTAPIRQPLRRTPIRFEGEEMKNLKDQLNNGVIRPSTSPWASNVVLVRKKDQTVRWCLDYRFLNDLTIKCVYPIPKIYRCIDCLHSVSVFSCFDLQSGYWQLQVEVYDIQKTTFITKYWLFEYTKMPFGLCNAPSKFQRFMELIFRGLQWQTLLIYLDDIIIFSSDINDIFNTFGKSILS
ncbi:Transposon Ty3-I Gag-Pol polyprotein,Transposon Ty3-G Gag-Pol polyprotein [Mytilus coruscus]|uniref:Transposon Ty3-I Gag-Pol polyprotein,Transposon Ty3-G Gag-Pol polyprotein n=1 Tax=Mytilus coruscus TaxID=42192 RepID=A0A6J8CQ21_MYTCO|nr:Transposon Ty3-I Gag-Pol polyprotein,Transposon Ty3-G Gag-Pol polyprotein [Mytilus coruscus]